MGALDMDFQQAMDTIAILAGSNFADLTYEAGQVSTICVQARAENPSTLEDTLLGLLAVFPVLSAQNESPSPLWSF